MRWRRSIPSRVGVCRSCWSMCRGAVVSDHVGSRSQRRAGGARCGIRATAHRNLPGSARHGPDGLSDRGRRSRLAAGDCQHGRFLSFLHAGTGRNSQRASRFVSSCLNFEPSILRFERRFRSPRAWRCWTAVPTATFATRCIWPWRMCSRFTPRRQPTLNAFSDGVTTRSMRYCLEDAELVIVMAGSFATKGKSAVQRWRRARASRWLVATTDDSSQTVCRLDSGVGGPTSRWRDRPESLARIRWHSLSRIVLRAGIVFAVDQPSCDRLSEALEARTSARAELDHVLQSLIDARPTDHPAEPELLFTKQDQLQVRQRLAIAGKVAEAGS